MLISPSPDPELDDHVYKVLFAIGGNIKGSGDSDMDIFVWGYYSVTSPWKYPVIFRGKVLYNFGIMVKLTT